MLNKIHSKKMNVGGLDVHYLTGGEGDPLVVIHGGGDGARAWLDNLEELSQCYTVYAPDLPGFGHSQPISDGFHASEFVEFMEGFANNLGLQRFHLVGHSVGGSVALRFALKSPRRIERLVLVSSMCLGKEIALWARFLSSPAFLMTLGEAGVALFKAVGWLIKSLHIPFEFMNPLPRVKISLGKSIMTLKGQTTVLLNQLSQLLVPTLLVWGVEDAMVPVAHAYAASELIADCQLHVFDACDHNVYKQKSQEFSHLLTRFLG
jgi:pimeloyl-ACP methyl ester carboxylesterase